MTSAETRLAREKQHGKNISSHAEEVWMRHTRSGQRRIENRFKDLQRFFGAGAGELLELGCGTGTWTVFLRRLNARITGVDISEDLLRVAREKTAGQAQFLMADIEHLPFRDNHFDTVCGLSVLHHLDITAALPEIYRVLKPGGKIWFSEPNMANPQIALQKNIPILKKWAGDTPDESAFFRWPLTRALKRAGFEAVQVEPFDFLHPLIPSAGTDLFDKLGRLLEKIPGLREIAGSLLIHARKPA
jgi:SAM-dependent methyltransferase